MNEDVQFDQLLLSKKGIDNGFREISKESETNVARMGADLDLQALSHIWVRETNRYKWSYNFAWMGRPAIQFPNDIWAMQELIWRIKPDLIIETGIAHGGSLIFSASMLSLLDYCDAIVEDRTLDPKAPRRRVLGLDIDIREHNRSAIEAHPMANRIDMIEGLLIPRLLLGCRTLHTGMSACWSV